MKLQAPILPVLLVSAVATSAVQTARPTAILGSEATYPTTDSSNQAVVYRDGLSYGWDDWSWDSNIQLASTQHAHASLSRMSPACYPAMPEETLPSSFAGWQNSGMACAGGYLTLSTSEWPSDATVCSLSDILETDVPRKYYLSAKAARGILRRAEKRGKELPPILLEALLSLSESTE